MSIEWARTTSAAQQFLTLPGNLTIGAHGWQVVAVGTALVTATPTETAKGQQLFLDEVRTLNGVLHVENYGGRTIGERSIRVHVRRGDLETEYAVYDLKGTVYQRYPDACLNVEVWLEDCPETAAAADPDTAPDAGTA